MNNQPNIFEFGRFRLDTEESRLLLDGQAIPLEPQVLKTLQVLVENSGHLCEKSWLIAQVWRGTIVEEGNLARNISVLRKVLGDRENGNHFIETIPKRGYRFVAAVTANGQNHETLLWSAKAQEYSATRLVRRKRWPLTAVLVGGAFVILIASLFLRKANSGVRGGTTAAPSIEFTQLTNALGEEAFPSLSPDGKLLVFTSSSGGSADNWSGNANIYLLTIGSNTPINLTGGAPGNGSTPAFSPDGSLIAFRSERDGGGIFIMNADGGNIKRLTEFGSHPSWSPDQKEIVFATDDTWSPNSRRVNPSDLWLINVATGEKRRLTTPGDAAQPSWSPHGHRVAFWGQNRGAKNIFTIDAYGGESVVVTNDSFVNWNPVWSPDGSYLYFASDRGGSMNLWRVQIDETSGAVLGSPTAVTTPSSGIGHLCFSRDGRHLAYVSATNTANIAEVSFDSRKAVVIGEPRWITRVTTSASMPDLSPDGQWLAYGNLGDKEEDIFVIRTDGTELRQITSDTSKDRRPRWSPDGKRIAFDSDRGGKLEIWIVNADGSGARQISSGAGPNMVEPVWAPDGKRLAFRTQSGGGTFIAEFGPEGNDRPAQIAAIPGSAEEDFRAHSWSPDGNKLAGWSYRRGRNAIAKDPEHKLCIYSFDTHRFEKLDATGVAPEWLNDNRRLIFAYNGELFLLDTESNKPHRISTPDASGGFSVSADGRKIYLSVASYQADIWMMNLP
ncbi:MAG: winged helix-turn-helix domain-containing protein [Pyrinomonadaceae bacterium]